MSRIIQSLLGTLTAFSLLSGVAAAQDSIASARDLYASAAYEDALAVLNRLPGANRPMDEARAIEQYRAFCLLALGRTAEAEHAIESVVAAEPQYRPASDFSPRVRTAFNDVRKRMLPSIIQRRYAEAKAAYDRKDFTQAASGFTVLLDLMNDPDAAAAVSQPPLSDIRLLAAGFKDLAATAAAPPPLPVVTAAPPPAATAAVAVPTPPRVYSPSDAAVTPPVTLRQELPPYPGTVPFTRTGMIEVTVDETGQVENAIMRVPVNGVYDTLALAAARNWRYRPAMMNGAPVKYRKSVSVTVKPSAAGNAR